MHNFDKSLTKYSKPYVVRNNVAIMQDKITQEIIRLRDNTALRQVDDDEAYKSNFGTFWFL